MSSTEANQDVPQHSRSSHTERKKQRMKVEHTLIPSATKPAENPFLVLPLELLAEILVLTRSTKDVFALSRCDKALYGVLSAKHASFIWRLTRNAATNPLPDPGDLFSEQAYAAFVYGLGKCEVCLAETTYMSFGLKLRLCNTAACIQSFKSEKATLINLQLKESAGERLLSGWVPSSEHSTRKYARPFRHFFGSRDSNITIFRKTAWPDAMKIYVQSDPALYCQQQQKVIIRNAKWMKFCNELFDWRNKQEELYESIKYANIALSGEFAMTHGWNYRDMMTGTSFGDFERNARNNFDEITNRDCQRFKPVIERELIMLSEMRKLRSKENAHRANHLDVEKHYNYLRSSSKCPVLPSLPVFRQIPIIHSLQSSGVVSPNMSISTTLKTNELMREQLCSQLNSWIDQARLDLSTQVGLPEWKCASTVAVHPVERMTMRFQCRECNSVSSRYANDGCLDFAGVCAHECVTKNGKKSKNTKQKWDAKNFVRDEKASAAMKTLLEILNLDEEQVNQGDIKACLPSNVICLSCPMPLQILTENVIGHSHRHSVMNMILGEISTGYPIINRGIVKRFLKPSFKAEEEREMHNFGCNHCLTEKGRMRLTQVENLIFSLDTATGSNSDENDTANQDKNEEPDGPKLFIWNGIRSHLKAKHGIQMIREEDFFCPLKPLQYIEDLFEDAMTYWSSR